MGKRVIRQVTCIRDRTAAFETARVVQLYLCGFLPLAALIMGHGFLRGMQASPLIGLLMLSGVLHSRPKNGGEIPWDRLQRHFATTTIKTDEHETERGFSIFDGKRLDSVVSRVGAPEGNSALAVLASGAIVEIQGGCVESTPIVRVPLQLPVHSMFALLAQYGLVLFLGLIISNMTLAFPIVALVGAGLTVFLHRTRKPTLVLGADGLVLNGVFHSYFIRMTTSAALQEWAINS